jgi:long-chain fatty acid transport protein
MIEFDRATYSNKTSRLFIGFFNPAMLGTLLFLNASGAYGAGYQIPNQSMRATGIAGATIAYTPGAESAYYNPANMSFLEDGAVVEASLTTLGLPAIDYSDNRSPLLNGSSDSELFFLPLFHFASTDYNDFRFGFSLAYPYGLAKEWQQPYPAATTRKFSLLVVEANPSVSYRVSERFSIAGGVRAIYGEGEAKSSITNPPFDDLTPLSSLTRDVDGDDYGAGYNLAATFRPIPRLSLAATYKSEVTLDLEGDAELRAVAGRTPVARYNGSGNIEVPLPAVFSLAASYSLSDVTIEITWNRTFWSALENLDFEYDQSFLGTVFDGFDRPLRKDWEDSDAVRLGITYQMTKNFVTTLGFAIDNTPVREETLGFELPDSDAYMYCLGLQYNHTEKLGFGLSYMYYHTTSRSVVSQSVGGGLPGIDGTFTDGGAHAVNIGLVYSFN